MIVKIQYTFPFLDDIVVFYNFVDHIFYFTYQICRVNISVLNIFGGDFFVANIFSSNISLLNSMRNPMARTLHKTPSYP